MSMTFYLTGNKAELNERYPDVEVSLEELWPSSVEYIYEDTDTAHVWSGHYFTHDKGWTKMEPTRPELNMSNSNAMYVLKDILGIEDADHCGMLEYPNIAYLTCKVHERNNPDCYHGIPALKKLISLALNNGWSIYWS